MQLEAAENASSQAKLETQRIREELAFANRNLDNLQSRLGQIEDSSSNNLTAVNSNQLGEIEELKSQNNLLKGSVSPNEC